MAMNATDRHELLTIIGTVWGTYEGYGAPSDDAALHAYNMMSNLLFVLSRNPIMGELDASAARDMVRGIRDAASARVIGEEF